MKPATANHLADAGAALYAHPDWGPSDLRSATEAPLDLPGGPVPIPTPGHTAGHCA